MWTQRAWKWTNPLYDSDPSASVVELQVCKLPTVWISPVENQHDSSSMNAHLSPAERERPGCEPRSPAVRSAKSGGSKRERLGVRSANEQIMPSNLSFEGITCLLA